MRIHMNIFRPFSLALLVTVCFLSSPGCGGSEKVVSVSGTVTHNGQPSYRKMAYIYVNRRGTTKFLQFGFSVRPGGSIPSWSPANPGTA